MQSSRKAKLRALGAAVRAERKRLKRSQEDFAEDCGVHRTYVGQVERGEINISFDNIAKIADAIGLKLSELFARAGL